MRYLIINEITNDQFIVPFQSDVDEKIENEVGTTVKNAIGEDHILEQWDFNVVSIHSCRACGEDKDDVQERSDFYGIFTGHYCEDCYENDYPYKKERYATMEHDGHGEYLGNDDY